MLLQLNNTCFNKFKLYIKQCDMNNLEKEKQIRK